MAAQEIISGPLDVYVWRGAAAPVFPDIDDVATDFVAADKWELLGKSGDNSMTEDGLTVSHPQEFFEVRTAGSNTVQKVFRTSEGLMLSFTLYDLRGSVYSMALGGSGVEGTGATDDVQVIAAASNVPGEKRVKLYRGLQVDTFGLLVRGVASPEYTDGKQHLQYDVPEVYQSASPEIVYTKGEAVGLAFEFMALASGNDPDLGTLRYQTDAAD